MAALLRRWLIWTHRYVGIPLSALFVLWFVSGIVMMYTGGMPELSPAARLERRADVDVSRVRLTSAAAAERGGVSQPPAEATLLSVLGRPAYRFDGVTVFADTGERLPPLGPDAAREAARRFTGAPLSAITHERLVVTPDQWMLIAQQFLPAHKLRVSDGAGTEIYVAQETADVAMVTTRRSRAVAWLGAIPHWFYLPALRNDRPLWEAVIVWTSAVGCLVAITGLLLGVTQLRWRRAHRGQRRVPYAGWLRWHYLSGVVFGLVTLTWVFSGMLSVQPFAWMTVEDLRVPPGALSGGPLELADFPPIDRAAWDRATSGRAVREVALLRIDGEPHYEVRSGRVPGGLAGGNGHERLVVDAGTLAPRSAPPDADVLVGRLRTALPAIPVAGATLIESYDGYYYGPRPRPPAAAGRAHPARRPAGDLDLRRPRRQPDHADRAPLQPPRALAVQRPAQPRLHLLVRTPAAVGRRRPRPHGRRARVGRHRPLARHRAGPPRDQPRSAPPRSAQSRQASRRCTRK